MFKTNPNTDQIMRSFLQKAVRRGNIELTKKTVIYLINNNDLEWVRRRLAVITFEECWPYGLFVSYEKNTESLIKNFSNLACTIKNKDAAGLGSMAYEYSEGDGSVLSNLDNEHIKYVKKVSDGIKNPESFWKWALSEQFQEERKIKLINKAYESFKKAGWPWDKAFVISGAFLAITENIPRVKFDEQKKIDLPFWVGIDKHTQHGKEAIRKISKDLKVDSNKALWISFYFESANCNSLTDSFWWDKEIAWRMRKINLEINEAIEIWSRFKPKLQEFLQEESKKIEEKINNIKYNIESSKLKQEQIGLFQYGINPG
jgi:hypothetical protein